jgi:hypothetical protein
VPTSEPNEEPVAKPSRRERDRIRTNELDARSSSDASGSPRAGRRSRHATARQRTFLDRFGGMILFGFAALGLVAVGALFLQSSTQTAYACDTLLTPGPTDPIPTATPAPPPSPTPDPSATPAPTPVPEPAPTQRLGFVVSDLGNPHVPDTSQKVTYAYCPPGSGPHWSIAGEAPAPRAFYQPGDAVVPQQWIHNLEHGIVVILYSCGADGKSCPTASEMTALKQVFDGSPTTAGAVTCGVPNKILVARFDQISTRFAMVAWDRALLVDAFDAEQALTFAQQWIDAPSAPERGACFR